MATVTLEELSDLSEAADGPALVAANLPRPGGVDPLGLRESNFELMNAVFPGINNVADHIRPFAIVTWAWHRAAVIADRLGLADVPEMTLQDFVARVEVIYVWSQYTMDDPPRLPGRRITAPLLAVEKYQFGGPAWESLKRSRADSTALSAPINYGPALRYFSWLQKDGMTPTKAADDAIAAIDTAMQLYLDHPAFSAFGDVVVKAKDVRLWADAWVLAEPSKAERKVMRASLAGDLAPKARRAGVALTKAAYVHLGGSPSISELRHAMCGAPSDFRPSAELEAIAIAWRTMQNRQVFRLALEALFFWVCHQLEDGAATTEALVAAFLGDAGDAVSTATWLNCVIKPKMGPVDWLDRLEQCLVDVDHRDELPAAIRGSLAACLAEAPDAPTGHPDRLPLASAAQEAAGWGERAPVEFLSHVIDSWVIGKHVYWSVWRGLADARARGRRMILRLRIALEDEGWVLTSGTRIPQPQATPDRLATMVSLMREAKALR